MLNFPFGRIPAGINIPNYDDIRQDFGFKNVSLGNVLSASAPSEKLTFLSSEDEEVFRSWRGRSFEVQVLRAFLALKDLISLGRINYSFGCKMRQIYIRFRPIRWLCMNSLAMGLASCCVRTRMGF
jgi:hypothetical protein